MWTLTGRMPTPQVEASGIHAQRQEDAPEQGRAAGSSRVDQAAGAGQVGGRDVGEAGVTQERHRVGFKEFGPYSARTGSHRCSLDRGTPHGNRGLLSTGRKHPPLQFPQQPLLTSPSTPSPAGSPCNRPAGAPSALPLAQTACLQSPNWGRTREVRLPSGLSV